MILIGMAGLVVLWLVGCMVERCAKELKRIADYMEGRKI